MPELPKDVTYLTKLMDDSISVPLINRTIGADFIIGLIPVAGDIVTTVISLYLVVRYWMLGARFWTLMHMLWNILLDFLISLVPIIGDIFDIGFKANSRNMQLWIDAQS